MHRILKIHLSEESIGNAISELKKRSERYDRNAMQLCGSLAQMAAETAQTLYGDAVSVTIEEMENGYRVVASGSAVCFLEFGAGDKTDVGNPLANNVPFDVYPGSWSKDHAKEYITKGYWKFGGKVYHYIEPKRGLATASAQIRSNVYKEAERIFGKA